MDHVGNPCTRREPENGDQCTLEAGHAQYIRHRSRNGRDWKNTNSLDNDMARAVRVMSSCQHCGQTSPMFDQCENCGHAPILPDWKMCGSSHLTARICTLRAGHTGHMHVELSGYGFEIDVWPADWVRLAAAAHLQSVVDYWESDDRSGPPPFSSELSPPVVEYLVRIHSLGLQETLVHLLRFDQ